MMDYIDVNIGRNQSKEFRIEVNVEKGVNDLLILCIRDPDNILDKEQYVPTGTVYLARRAVTIKGVEYKQKNIPPKKITIYKENESNDGSRTSPYVVLENNDKKELSMNRIPNSFSGSMYLKMGNSSKRTNYAIFAILGSELMKIETPYIIVHEKGDFKLKLMDLPIEGELNKN